MVPHRVVILGIDALNFNVLDPLIQEGALPNFKALKEISAHSKMRSIIPSVTGPAWTTITTGMNPGKHGIFDFVKVGDDSVKVNSSSDIEGENFMHILSRMGKRCVVIGVPYSYPPGKMFNGIAVSDFLHPKLEIFPPEKSEYLKNYRNTANVKDLTGVDLVRDLIDLTKRQTELGRKILTKEEWDLFFFYTLSIDTFFHNFFGKIGTDSDEWTEGKEIFREVDSFLGDLMEATKGDYLMVISDHGFRMYQKTIYMNRILESQGMMVRSFALSKGSRKASSGPKAFFGRIVKLPMVFPLARFVYRILRKVAGGEIKVALEEGIDIKKSLCYVPTRESMGVYIGARGKGERDRLISFLKGLEHEGAKVLDRVVKREEVYSGKNMEKGPDILIYSGRYAISANIYGKDHFGGEKAYHDMEAAFFLKGPGIRSGMLTEMPDLVDIAPTVLRLFGVKRRSRGCGCPSRSWW